MLGYCCGAVEVTEVNRMSEGTQVSVCGEGSDGI